MDKLVKVPIGQKVGMSKGAKIVFNLSGDQWVEMVVTEDITGTPFQITDTKISNVFYGGEPKDEGYGRFVPINEDMPPTSTFNPPSK